MCTGSNFSHGREPFELAISSDTDLDERAGEVVTMGGHSKDSREQSRRTKTRDIFFLNEGGVEREKAEKCNIPLHVGCFF